MNRHLFQWSSLKTRVTLFTLAIFLTGIWSLALYAGRILRNDIEKLLGEQQLATVSFVANEINDELGDRLGGLELVAAGITPALLGNPAALRAYLEQRPLLLNLFTGGVIAYGPDATPIVDVTAPGRAGIAPIARDTLLAALADGRSTIGRPVLEPASRTPTYRLTVPIRDSQGQVAGALSGLDQLVTHRFLDKVAGSRYGRTGGYLLLAAQQRQVIFSSDRERIAEGRAAPGVSALTDRFNDSPDGYSVEFDPRGEEILSSVRRVALADWKLVAYLPTAEAFAPIHDMQQRLRLATLLLTLLAAGLTWWMLRRQLSPMLAAVETLTAMSDTNEPLHALTITRQDEIGQLIGGFNRLLEVLTQREKALQQAERNEQFRSRILELHAQGAPLPNILEALVRRVEQMNPAMLCSILLLDRDGTRLGIGAAPSLPDFFNAAIDGLAIGGDVGSCGTAVFTGQRVIVEDIQTHPHWTSYKDLAARAGLAACWSQPIVASSGRMLGTFAIYHRQVQAPAAADLALIDQSASLASIAIEGSISAESLRDSEERFRNLFEKNSSVMLLLDPAARTIIDANQAAAVYYGYPRERLVGMPLGEINIWAVERTAEALQSVLDGECNYVIVQHRLSSHEIRDVEVHTTPIQNGGRTLLFSIVHDITERRRAEAELRIAAVALNAQEAMMVTDAQRVILRVNQAFCEITGYSVEEAVGQTPHLLQSDRHNAGFYREMWEAIHLTGGWQGEVWDRRKNGEEYPKWLTISAVRGDDGSVTNYVGTHHDITERKKAEGKIAELAFFDPLTNLPNRTLLIDRLKQGMTASNRNATFGAVLFIDLDHFKTLNDTQGHDKGDMLLCQVAQRLAACVREGDTVARLGGDEFVVVLGSLKGSAEEAANQTEVVGEKILAAIGQIYQLGNVAHRSTASIGATLFRGHETSIDDLLKQADLAMYKSKDTGRNTLRFFDPAMQTVVMERVSLEADLRRAIVEQQFALHYQAQVDDQGRITGAEALLRWQHLERGMVPPADFIPLAEETGLILALGQWVLTTTCRQLAAWATRADMAHLSVAVNVSARQFRDPAFVDKVLAILDETGANPERLKLELTESLLADNVQDIIDKMCALKSWGVGFSLDDFGTGYSSLSYLKRLPLDQLKIDQSFVHDVLVDPNDAAIARTIVALALSLGLGVIAEGVESEAQRVFLATSGCLAYQGYLFSRPLPLAEFEAFVRRA